MVSRKRIFDKLMTSYLKISKNSYNIRYSIYNISILISFLGPKALLVFQLLSFGRDEVVWLIKHSSRENQNKRTHEEDFRDRTLVELLFYIEDLRNMVLKHSEIISKYYAGLMSQFNASVLNEVLSFGFENNFISRKTNTVGGSLFCNFRTRKSYQIRGTLQIRASTV